MTSQQQNEARRSIWRRRGARFATGANVLVAVLIAAAVLGLVNVLAHRLHARFDISTRRYYELSDKTRGILGGSDAKVTVAAFISHDHELYEHVRNLLREYEYEAERADGIQLDVRMVDPNRDVVEAGELAKRYGVKDSGVIVFAGEERVRPVDVRELMDVEQDVDVEKLLQGQPAVRTERVAFRGEQMFSSAIHSVAQQSVPVVYFLTGHRERDVADFSTLSGFAHAARLIRRDNMEVRSLLLATQSGVPDDCSALVIAGPEDRLSRAEADQVSAYLERSGRLLLLVDPGVETGLEEVLLNWGVSLGPETVVDPGLTGSARELLVRRYDEDHPVTRSLKNGYTIFTRPRCVGPAAGAARDDSTAPDRPRVTVLAAGSPKGWAETDLETTSPRFDPETDTRGPNPLAVAVEKGPVGDIDVELKPARIVVIGDSSFVSNHGIRESVGGNVNLLLNALNWLVEQENLMAIAAKSPQELHLGMSVKQKQTAFLLLVVAVPGAVALAGIAIWMWRRN